MAEPESDSIFEFADRFGIDSPLGNWTKPNDEISIQRVEVGIDRVGQIMNASTSEKTDGFENWVALVIGVSTTGMVQAVTVMFGNVLYAGRPIVHPHIQETNGNTFFVNINIRVPVPYQIYKVKFTVEATSISGKIVSKTISANLDKKGIVNETKEIRSLCHGDLSTKDMESILMYLRKSEIIGNPIIARDKNNTKNFLLGEPLLDQFGNRIMTPNTQYLEMKLNLFSYTMDEVLNPMERNMASLAQVFNMAFREANLNSCILRVHFIAQCYHETGRFMKTYEASPSGSVAGGPFYRGRGFMQLTHRPNYEAFYKSIHGSSPTDAQLVEFVPTVATSIEMAMKASVWYWKKERINDYASKDDVVRVSAAINYPAAINDSDKIPIINGLPERKTFTNFTKGALNYEECK